MDLVELAKAGVRQLFMSTPLIETERFKEGLARLDAELMAARALFEAQVTGAWRSPVPAALTDLTGVAEQLQAAIWVAEACVRVVEGCFELAGSRAVYESLSLQRRVRDVRTAAQHFTLQQRQYVMAGAGVLARLSGEHAPHGKVVATEDNQMIERAELSSLLGGGSDVYDGDRGQIHT